MTEPDRDDTNELEQLPEGHLIQAARKERGLNQGDAARQAGFSERQWRRYEKGCKAVRDEKTGETFYVRVRMSDATLVKMASIVGVRSDELRAHRPAAARELDRQRAATEATEQLLQRAVNAHTPQGRAYLLKAMQTVWGEDPFAEAFGMMNDIDEAVEPPTVLPFPQGRAQWRQAR